MTYSLAEMVDLLFLGQCFSLLFIGEKKFAQTAESSTELQSSTHCDIQKYNNINELGYKKHHLHLYVL